MSLTMTYFHGGGPTIIGAVLFHGPVRDGKGWFQDAMVVRLQLVEYQVLWAWHSKGEEVWGWVIALASCLGLARL
jgi:hypothetical protein